MSHHHALRRLRLPSRSSVVAALSAVALGSTCVAAFSGSAAAVAVTELDLAWSGAPPSIGNGDPLHGVMHVNLNDHLGEEGEDPNHVITFDATGGVFTRLPSACRTDGDPVSAVLRDGARVRCNLGRVRFGTAMEIDFTVLARAHDGDAVSVSATDGTHTATLTPVPVTAPPGIDVVFNEAQRVQANAAWQATFPVALSLPAGAADVHGPIAFDVVIADKTSTNAPSAIHPDGSTCVPLASTNPPSSMPPTSPQAPVPSACTVTETSSGVLHVTIDGYRTPAAVDPPTSAADGASLPTDRHFFAAFGIRLRSPNGVQPATSSFQMTVAHVAAATTSGAPTTEVDAANNTETVAITAPGGYAHNWAHAAPTGTRIVGGGGPWAASYYAASGDQILSNTTSGTWGAQKVSQIPAGSTWETCEVLDGPATFDGFVQPEEQSTNSYAIAPLPADAYSWAVYRGPLPPSGTRDAFDCGTVAFTSVTATTIGTSAGECGCAHEERLDVPDLGAVTAVKLIVDPAKLARASDLGATPPRIGLHTGVHIAADASAADVVWTLGSVSDRTGDWRTASQVTTAVAPAPGAYPTTNALRDVMRIIGSRPYVDKTVDHPDVRAGDIVTFRVRTGASADLGTGSADWRVVDTMPSGLEYEDGSASRAPDHVETAPNGPTVLVWSFNGPVNTDTVLTYRARVGFTTGSRTNTAAASVATHADGPESRLVTDEDTAQVVYAGDGHTLLTKAAGSSTFAAGGTNTWTLGLENLDHVDQDHTDIIDVLPWNGDARGSAFHGSAAVDSVSAGDDETVYYATAAPASINTDPAAPANGGFASPSGVWSTSPPRDRSAVTAIRIVGGRFAAGAAKTAVIAWHPVHGRSGDRYQNIAWAKATHTSLQMIKAAASATIADGSRLQISKEFTATTGWATNDRLSYRITVHNPSDSVARDVRVADLGGNGNDPASVEFSDMSQGAFDGAARTWRVGDLQPKRTVTATVSTAIPGDADRTTPFVNLTYVENPSNPYDPDPKTPCQTNNVSVLADVDQCDLVTLTPPHLRIDKHADAATAEGSVTWTIHVRVDGSVGAHGVHVDDVYPAGIDHTTLRLAGPPTHGTIDLETGRWTVGDLQPGAVAAVTFQAHVAVTAGSRIVNTATVDSTDVVRTTPTGDGSCQPNDGPTSDAALDADTDQCDQVETVFDPPRSVQPPKAPAPAPTGPAPHQPTTDNPSKAPVPAATPSHQAVPVRVPAHQVVPAPTPTGLERLPDTGGPSRWIGLVGGTSAAAAAVVGLTGRRRRHRGGSHRC